MSERRYTPDETQDYYFDADDIPTQTRRFCFTHGFEDCDGVGCEVIEEQPEGELVAAG